MKLIFITVCSLSNAIFLCCLTSSSMHLNQPITTQFKGNETDRLALLAIKAQIHDPNHQVMSSWNDSIHFCMWSGVTCSRRHHQRVTMLVFYSQRLASSISPHIGNLSFLREIDLFSNSFTHEIPLEIGHFSRLQVLYRDYNSFTGPIPTNIFHCFNLTILSLEKNKLVGDIPSELGFLSKLQEIEFQGKNLTGQIPPSFGNLSSLRV
ncbi:putative non-specific serine/threonine protein kinase [Rosa chinensis]|uniref:Putative non-specific serine/threonine protein kinase n=1 Tax=Rosa chinensis TaxID=74649 RepID=A0A2P6SHH6_ROSCH|nr:putative non-specific serine/threonine protein kinase [Rosa chinensis]